MPLFHVFVRIDARFDIEADSAKDADRLARQWVGARSSGIELEDPHVVVADICNDQYQSIDLAGDRKALTVAKGKRR